jgi:MFS family permease
MELITFLKTGRWTAAFGYLLFIGMMAVGYYYNVTFIQLGVADLGARLIGLSERSVAMHMAYLALITGAVALACGLWMSRTGWARQFSSRLCLAFLVVLVQCILTAVAPSMRGTQAFLAWIVATAAVLGIGVPVMFSLTADLIRWRDRGYVAAIITALVYFAAPVLANPWHIERLCAQVLPLMIGGGAGLAVLAFKRLPLTDELGKQGLQPEFRYGRYSRPDKAGRPWVRRKLFGCIILMFAVYFVDSLGFLRLIATPAYADNAWRSPDVTIRASIGAAHVLAALIAGVLYSTLGQKCLFPWTFGIFALVHLLYTFDLRAAPSNSSPLLMPMLYAVAVSLYTVVNFAIWADLSTPGTIARNAALGVALSGWTATFLSTALAMQWRTAGVSTEQHLNTVNSLAMLVFMALLLLWLLPLGVRHSRQQTQPEEGEC